MFLRNYWYVAALSEEVGDRPLGRTILGQPVVLFRDSRRRIAALEDRCAHRLMPLSQGWVTGDILVCCYHGVAYDGTGACARVPARDTPIPGMRVRAFPTVERYGAIWIWIGDADRADASEIPECARLDPEGRDGSRIYLYVKANYMFINDNLCDLLHIAYLHNADRRSEAAIGADGMELGALDVGETDGRIHANWTWHNIPPPPRWRQLGNIKGMADGWVLSSFVPPSFFVNPTGFADAGTGGPESTVPQGAGQFSFTLYQCITPETERSTHFFKLMAHRWDPAMAENGVELIRTVNAEDIWAMELQQASIDRDPTRGPIRFPPTAAWSGCIALSTN